MNAPTLGDEEVTCIKYASSDRQDIANSQSRMAQEICTQNGGLEFQSGVGRDERNRLWQGRRGAFGAVARLAPNYLVNDSTVPRTKLPEALARVAEITEEYGCEHGNVFHAGDGNLHPLILYNGNIPGEVEKAEELGLRILKLSVELGGSITGEHGVGVEKLDAMCDQFNSDELALFHALKVAFDPHSLLNPGKAIPTLARCAEFGSMHVHNGELPFPDIERF